MLNKVLKFGKILFNNKRKIKKITQKEIEKDLLFKEELKTNVKYFVTGGLILTGFIYNNFLKHDRLEDFVKVDLKDLVSSFLFSLLTAA